MSTSAGPTMQQAFAAAKEEHSTMEQAPAPEASTAPAEPSKPAQDTEKAAGAPSVTAESNDLVSDTDWAAISQLSPEKQRAELNKRWTQKTQDLAATRKTLARLEKHADLVDDYEADPEGTARRLASQFGLLTPPPAPAPSATPENPYLADAKAALGPDLEFLAGPFAALVEKAVAPHLAKIPELEKQQASILSQAAQAEVDGHLAAFEKAHPDWKDHEQAMMKLGLVPGPNMTAGDYLEACYRLATFDKHIEKAKADAVVSMSKAAEAAEKETRSVNPKQVTPAAPKNASMRDAYAAAKRGEQWA